MYCARTTSKLNLAVRSHIIPLAQKLLEVELITSENHSSLLNTHNNEVYRAAQLVKFIQEKVKLDPNNYHIFVKALKSEESTYKEVLEGLEPIYREPAEEKERQTPATSALDATHNQQGNYNLSAIWALVVVVSVFILAILIPAWRESAVAASSRHSVTPPPSPSDTPMNPTPKLCHEMVYADVPELTQIIGTHGSTKEWCLYLRISQGTCNRLDYSRQHIKHTIIDIAQAYLNEKLHPCWEEIVCILCRDMKMKKPAKELAQKHGISYESLCTVTVTV